jgi:hypothetical protein
MFKTQQCRELKRRDVYNTYIRMDEEIDDGGGDNIITG